MRVDSGDETDNQLVLLQEKEVVMNSVMATADTAVPSPGSRCPLWR